jgi:hypothetical protein
MTVVLLDKTSHRITQTDLIKELEFLHGQIVPHEIAHSDSLGSIGKRARVTRFFKRYKKLVCKWELACTFDLLLLRPTLRLLCCAMKDKNIFWIGNTICKIRTKADGIK